MATRPNVTKPAARPTTAAPVKKDVGAKFKAMATAAVAASVMGREGSGSDAAPGSPQVGEKGAGRAKVTRYVDPKVAARNGALNAMGGVKVDVFVRVRPKCAVDGDDPIMVTLDYENAQIVLEDPTGHPAKYTYDKIYGMDSTQEQLYEDSVAPIIEQVCRGLSCAIFAYGQTGAGKTYTMRGDLSTAEDKLGIIQRSVMHLFRRLSEHDYSEVKVSASFLEIYNEELEDLLVDKSKDAGSKAPTPKKAPAPSKLNLVDDPDRGCVCQGLTEAPVATLEEVMKLLAEAEARCRFSETKMNKMSNRAHRIFTLIVNFKRYDNPVLATLTFVDLAGSEDISKSGAKGLTAREASHINKSLLTLGRVINTLACNEKHIPYRDSKLTRLLSEALGGVCKTSFIACVSPCASSQTETNSTLRYAERAMEALNISQLPRWKQDEIMIDGLTRRVQQLLDEMDLKDRCHREDMIELKNDKAALTAENGALKRDLGHANRKIGRLLDRKQRLKTGLGIQTQQRELLQVQREALQAELLETRRVRDGYLADRSNVATVLTGVRAMRERLLKAHRETESLLSRDAQTLKRTIEGAIGDIDELHVEVQRKKALSVHNENLADNFKDRVSSKLRGIVQAASEFKIAQDEAFAGTSEMVSDMRSLRQQETSTLRADLARLSASVSSAFADISKFAKDADAATKVRVSGVREASEAHRDEVEVAVGKVRAQVVVRLEELRLHAASLEDNLTAWADKMKSKMDETLGTSQRFGTALLSQVAAVQAHLEGASATQLAHLEEHGAALQKHFETEKATVAAEAERVISDITSYVQRLLGDHATQATRRTEKAVAGFRSAAESVCEETREALAHQLAEHASLQARTNDWSTATATSLDEGQRANAAAHLTAAGLVKKAVGSSQQAETEVTTGAQTLTGIATHQRDVALQQCKDAEAASAAAAAAVDKQAVKATADVHGETKRMQDVAAANADSYEHDVARQTEHLGLAHEHLRKHVEGQTDDLFDTEADSVKYVMQEIKRDKKENAKRKEYVYPKEYSATAEYGTTLKDVASDWAREVAVRDGKSPAGQGVDYSGEKGAPDVSGLLTTTKPKALQPADQEALDTAAHQSDAGEYSSDGEHVEDDENGGGEVAL